MIRLLIAAQHSMVRGGVRLGLEDEADFKIVGEAADLAQAVKLAMGLRPTIVIAILCCRQPAVSS